MERAATASRIRKMSPFPTLERQRFPAYCTCVVSAVGLLSDWISQQHDLLEKNGEHVQEGWSGMQEPPVTPVARDELALRRHRFFSELLQVAQNTEHRVRFDPLGPRVHTG